MATPSIGPIVVVPFPFSDLSNAKLRPALMLANVGRGDFLCVQITINACADQQAVKIENHDFDHGSLQRVSYARPGKLFTANDHLFQKQSGVLNHDSFLTV